MIEKARTVISRSLGRVFVRSTIYVVFLLLTFMGLSVAVGSYQQSQRVQMRLEANAAHLGQLAVDLAAVHIADNNLAALVPLLNDFEEVNNVSAIKLVDNNGFSLLSAGVQPGPVHKTVDVNGLKAIQSGEATTENFDDYLVRIAPIVHDNKTVGALLLTLSKDEMKAATGAAVLQATEVGLFLFLTLVPLGAFLMFRSTRGISAVTEAAKEAAHGYLQTDFSKKSLGEVGELENAFATMVTNLRDNIRKIEQVAYNDNITRLPNRTRFTNLATKLIDMTPNAKGSIMFLDLDRFKLINDTHGHVVGDKLLKVTADRLLDLAETLLEPEALKKAVIARFSSDEFVAILPGEVDPDKLQDLADAIIEGISKPVSIGHLKLSVGASIGIALYPEYGDTADEILKSADIAMFAAKESGRGRAMMFNSAVRDEVLMREALERDLRTALKAGNLSVHYQPKIDMDSGRIMGSEALLRWRHPEFGPVSPEKFIPIAEECGLISPLGEYVLARSLADMVKLKNLGHDNLSIAVNVAPVQFNDTKFSDRTLGIIGESAFPPEQLELELTETTVAMSSDNLVSQMMPIKEEGVRFAIDDFGTGYSSLDNLATLPFDTLKIDRSFVMSIADDDNRKAIIRLILRMAEQLRMKTVAEGIETAKQLDHLRGWGTHYAQGFFWSPPVSFDEFSKMVADVEAGRFGSSDLPEKPKLHA